MKRTVFLLTSAIVMACHVNGQTVPVSQERIAEALKSGELAWQFSDPSEIIKLFGEPTNVETGIDGGMEFSTYQYSNTVSFLFGRYRNGENKHFGLRSYRVDGNDFGRNPDEILKPRNLDDLNRLNSFEGYSDMDLSKLDLRQSSDTLKKYDFNTSTKWPSKQQLPEDFDPIEILRSAKNPGLGVKQLHAKGLDGKGVDIAIIDQPTLENHIDYKDNIKMLIEMFDHTTTKAQPHGPFVTSISAGKSCGVAPNANVYYFSMPMWEKTNSYYIQAIKRVMELNEKGTAGIKAISISTGTFHHFPDYNEFQQIVAEAESKGISVFTCAGTPFGIPTHCLFNVGILRPTSIYSRESPEDFVLGSYSDGSETMLVPGDNQTYASESKNDVFTYSVNGGRSNAPPWLAGLVAIGYQVNPRLSPADVKKYLLDSASKMPYGNVVNPLGFIELCKTNTESGDK
jgi:hypothetical protein